MSPSSYSTARHLRILLVGTFLSRLYTCILIVLSASFLPLFDSSPTILLGNSWQSSFLRWDAFYFTHIAENGYVYEHEWAFFPGIPLLMRFASQFLTGLTVHGDVSSDLTTSLEWTMLLQGGALAALACDSTRTLYHLSLHHLGSPSLAFVSAALSLLPSSPAALRFAAYTEPIFTFMSYRGMLYCTRSQWLFASACFAFASVCRSNGVMLSGFIVWGMLVEPFLNGQYEKLSFTHILYTILLTALPILPFIYHNYMAYLAFCSTTAQPAEWCTRRFPSIYAHVQDKYWNVGFLRYWTFQQLPNFIISLPVLLIIYIFAFNYFSALPTVLTSFPLLSHTRAPKPKPRSPFLSSRLLPHVLYATLLTLILTFSAHTQIALRTLPAVPVTYWSAAWLLLERPMLGKAWVAWSMVWGSLSAVLWGVFLPPA
ncbi:glycosyltransferase family 76 protein [Serpula lacrymans var. lacrymans S7.3]|uniref:GPI mannosyltransferase 2 n=2 Tax=Serpula lacrymans var. lacrymans TaxID=341189 RepID=F8PU02_SERL3|nr:glycosyltransferase family 76 protein [Serpula lacrymans var. lacrymans S7.9]EGN99627.1 glycosyltransferase family 76 protein [Serpula lacrymans var. lacrymans S7.3]EGO25192.1 glycosyltransferase family 76 protein [Serpula lacrymans var. lacrymans S7.9]